MAQDSKSVLLKWAWIHCPQGWFHYNYSEITIELIYLVVLLSRHSLQTQKAGACFQKLGNDTWTTVHLMRAGKIHISATSLICRKVRKQGWNSTFGHCQTQTASIATAVSPNGKVFLLEGNGGACLLHFATAGRAALGTWAIRFFSPLCNAKELLWGAADSCRVGRGCCWASCAACCWANWILR